jgi:hypothetical protein
VDEAMKRIFRFNTAGELVEIGNGPVSAYLLPPPNVPIEYWQYLHVFRNEIDRITGIDACAGDAQDTMVATVYRQNLDGSLTQLDGGIDLGQGVWGTKG